MIPLMHDRYQHPDPALVLVPVRAPALEVSQHRATSEAKRAIEYSRMTQQQRVYQESSDQEPEQEATQESEQEAVVAEERPALLIPTRQMAMSFQTWC